MREMVALGGAQDPRPQAEDGDVEHLARRPADSCRGRVRQGPRVRPCRSSWPGRTRRPRLVSPGTTVAISRHAAKTWRAAGTTDPALQPPSASVTTTGLDVVVADSRVLTRDQPRRPAADLHPTASSRAGPDGDGLSVHDVVDLGVVGLAGADDRWPAKRRLTQGWERLVAHGFPLCPPAIAAAVLSHGESVTAWHSWGSGSKVPRD